LTTGLTTVLNEQPLFVQPVVKPGYTTGLTTGCIHDTTGCQRNGIWPLLVTSKLRTKFEMPIGYSSVKI